MADAWGVERSDIISKGKVARTLDRSTGMDDLVPPAKKGVKRVEQPWKNARSGQSGVGGPMVIGSDVSKGMPDSSDVHAPTNLAPLHKQRRREARLSPLGRGGRAGTEGVAKAWQGVGKADTSIRGGVSATYTPPKSKVTPEQIGRIRGSLQPLKAAAVLATKK